MKMLDPMTFANELEAGIIDQFEVHATEELYLSGWASTKTDRTWGYICCRTEDRLIQFLAVANRFSKEAYDKNLGKGWIGFAIDLQSRWELVRGRTLTFHCIKSDRRIFQYEVPDRDPTSNQRKSESLGVRELVLRGQYNRRRFEAWQLSHYCDSFIEARGKEEFVRRAYPYVFGRTVDPTGLYNYVRFLEQGLAAHEMLAALMLSPEFIEKRNVNLAVPGDVNFPFYSL